MFDLGEQENVTILRMADGKANAMSIEFCQALTAHLDRLKSSPARAIVLTGERAIFSAGLDLIRLRDGGASYIGKLLPALDAMLMAVFSHPKPIIAAINGHAAAGGCVLACAADRRIMAAGTGRIGLTELLVGIPFPTVPLEIMRCAILAQYFAEAIFSGATYPPAEAKARGFIHDIVEPAALLDRSIAEAKALAGLPAAVFALTKQQIREPTLERIRHDARASEVARFWTMPETIERIRAYVDRTLRKS
jgi:enoyl-CoA hydratase